MFIDWAYWHIMIEVVCASLIPTSVTIAQFWWWEGEDISSFCIATNALTPFRPHPDLRIQGHVCVGSHTKPTSLHVDFLSMLGLKLMHSRKGEPGDRNTAIICIILIFSRRLLQCTMVCSDTIYYEDRGSNIIVSAERYLCIPHLKKSDLVSWNQKKIFAW